MKRKIYFLLVLWVVSACEQKERAVEELLRVPYISTVDDLERDFFLYLPKGYADEPEKEWPVIMFLHGNGERGNGKDELGYTLIHGPLYEAWIQKRDIPFIIIVPQKHMFGTDTLGISYIDNRTTDWIPVRLAEGVPERPKEGLSDQLMKGVVDMPVDSFPPNTASLRGWNNCEQDLMNIIKSVLTDYHADAKRVYLTGLSSGGYGTWYMASKHPETFAAISPLVGVGHPDMMAPIAEHQIGVWAFAGGKDNGARKEYFYAGMNRLQELGDSSVRFTVHEDMGHDVWTRVYGGNDIYDWFLGFSKE
ncbi:MAG: prolyl oligopeptidase family serine peptidase [Cyclobacteriaceae bacterium]|nr:prolyl oligopeptidase family serine peptidase [Cyclobacteriaceae bacterium]MDH5249480.1 prolyl oligopeptidase family serine peptidase [Cyclobacteriaceae bacterium]